QALLKSGSAILIEGQYNLLEAPLSELMKAIREEISWRTNHEEYLEQRALLKFGPLDNVCFHESDHDSMALSLRDLIKIYISYMSKLQKEPDPVLLLHFNTTTPPTTKIQRFCDNLEDILGNIL